MPTTVTTEEELRALLESLGSTSAEVAASLVKAGVKGVREEPGCCPVARWLEAETGMVPAVTPYDLRLRLAPEASPITVEPPPQLKEFVLLFDDGAYPDLDEDPYVPIRQSDND